MKWEDGALHILLKDYLRNGRLSSFEIVCLFFLFIALVFGRVMSEVASMLVIHVGDLEYLTF